MVLGNDWPKVFEKKGINCFFSFHETFEKLILTSLLTLFKEAFLRELSCFRYHAITFGWLVDGVFRKADEYGRDVKTFFKEEIADKYGKNKDSLS